MCPRQGAGFETGDSFECGAQSRAQFAELVVLSGDYFSIPEDAIKEPESVMTVVGGKVVYGAGLAPAAPFGLQHPLGSRLSLFLLKRATADGKPAAGDLIG